MPSPYSSELSQASARQLAGNLNVAYNEIPIHALMDDFRKQLHPLFKNRASDVTEENIQARIRGTLLMAYSNKFNYLVLSTGNKSEMAMGYCTLYGDMVGGLAVLADVPKTLVYRLAQSINLKKEIIPTAILTRPPSAELRFNQTDQESLPPYDQLDPIIHDYLVEGLEYPELVEKGHDPAILARVLPAIDRNEYKRQQAAPTLRITTKAFGMGRRIPIVHRFQSLPSDAWHE